MNDLPHRDVDVFTEALQKLPSERAAFLAQACAGDASLRGRVDLLLEAHEQAGTFLGEPVAGLRCEPLPGVEPGEKPGDRIGHYKLLQQIGEGGCGVVFMAEQQEPVRRRVALKVVKPGMDTKSVIARFEAERQALALMDHPNIAHVLEAGATESGRPYFVMELVRGVKITDYCNQNSLTTDARLALFMQVCEAVQHAHQKGIIHRDIKPSNILVTTNEEGKALPKVIDFGIAKATTGQRLTDKTLFTAFELLIGTPAYMSPEQAALASVDVDTRTDVYSLGVLLYELLTGTTPFDTRELLKAGLDEVRRVIRNEEPVRPSTRLRTMLAADLTTISGQRRAQPPNLIREMRGDLDWIVMKAMEKDRTRRYQTANALGEDVKHFLADEAVAARPPSAYYKLQKLALRNKLAFAAGGVILVLLLTGLNSTIWLLAKERQARLEADAARDKAETNVELARLAAAENAQATRFFEEILRGVAPSVARGRDTTVLKEILESTLKSMDKEFTNQLALAADLRASIGEVYVELGAFEKGAALENEALEVYRRAPASTDRMTAGVLYNLSVAHQFQNKTEEAEKEIREALALHIKAAGESNEVAVKMESEMAHIISLRGDLDGAVALYRKALATARLLPDGPTSPTIDTMNGLAMVLQTQRHLAEAEGLLRDAVARERKLYAGDSPSAATLLFNLANVLNQEHKFAEAESLCRECVAIRRSMLGTDHPWFESALQALGAVLQNEGKLAEGEPVFAELLAVRRKLLGDEDPLVLDAFAKLSEALAMLHRDAEAQRVYDEMLAVSGEGSQRTARLWQLRAEYFARRSQWPEAADAAARVLAIMPNDHAGYHIQAPLFVEAGNRGGYEELCGKIAAHFRGTTDPYAADRMAKDCLILPRPDADLKVPVELADTAVTLGRGSPSFFFFECSKALAEYRQGHWDKAIDWGQRAATNTFPYSRAEACAIVAMAQWQSKNAEEARSALAQCADIVEKKFPKLESGDLGNDWRDWIIARALLAEARSLVQVTPRGAVAGE